jgi:hypothetical protein
MSDVGTGLLQGAQFGGAIQTAMNNRRQRKLDTASREASAGAIPGAPPAAPAVDPNNRTGIVGNTLDGVDNLKSVVGKFYDKLRGRTLNDNHISNDDDAPIPMPQIPQAGPDGTPIPIEQGATIAATTAAATDPSASAGIPQDSAKKSKKHSMTREDDDELEERIMEATRAAALAGHDPQEVYKSLSSIKTAHYQGNILKNLNAAGVALQRGDTKAVEQALKNVYYYFPDGDELTMKHDAQGRLLYQDPFNPQNEDGSDNYIPVDAAHLQMLGMAAIDSTKLNDAIVGAKTAAVERQAKLQNAQAATDNATTRRGELEVKQKLVPSQIYLNTAKGAEAEAKSRMDSLRLRLSLKGNGQMTKQSQEASDKAARRVFQLAQGQETTVPVLDEKGNPNFSPAAGKTIRDPAKVPTYLKGKSPDQLVTIAATAGNIASANVGRMSQDEAVQIAARLEDARAQYHDTVTGETQPNVRVSKDGNWAQLWNGVSADGQDLGYRTIQVSPQLGSALASGRSVLPTEDEANAEGGDLSLGADEEDPGYNPDDPHDDPSYHVPAIPAG